MSRPCAVLFFATVSLLAAGCGGKSMAPVKGQVTFNGKPVPEAAITFAPMGTAADEAEPGKPGTGFTDADGRYELSSYKEYDGAVVGQHKVKIVVDDTNPIKCKRFTETTLEVQPGENELNIELK
jgi:uncharacterized GH25 family protein